MKSSIEMRVVQRPRRRGGAGAGAARRSAAGARARRDVGRSVTRRLLGRDVVGRGVGRLGFETRPQQRRPADDRALAARPARRRRGRGAAVDVAVDAEPAQNLGARRRHERRQQHRRDAQRFAASHSTCVERVGRRRPSPAPTARCSAMNSLAASTSRNAAAAPSCSASRSIAVAIVRRRPVATASASRSGGAGAVQHAAAIPIAPSTSRG